MGFELPYDLDARRFHIGGDDRRHGAGETLGDVPRRPVEWLQPWWRRLVDLSRKRRVIARRAPSRGLRASGAQNAR